MVGVSLGRRCACCGVLKEASSGGRLKNLTRGCPVREGRAPRSWMQPLRRILVHNQRSLGLPVASWERVGRKRESGYVARDVIRSESKTLERTKAQEGIDSAVGLNPLARKTDPLLERCPEGGECRRLGLSGPGCATPREPSGLHFGGESECACGRTP
jgi:hypothetical protein